ncbi:MAG: hypothetical protein MJ201_00175 [Mycoplasmoidaceae bacterium]|nr:hypothetical protein [Mycoplasmoidaceae bacterium]
MALMPANSRNIAADAYNQIANLAGHKYASQFPSFFKYDDETDTYSFITDMETVGYALMAFNPDFIHLITTLYSDPEIIKLEYPITYGSIPLNWDKHEGDKLDETYTYVSGNITQLSNNRGFDASHEIKIEGITQNSQYIKLTDKQGNDLNK